MNARAGRSSSLRLGRAGHPARTGFFAENSVSLLMTPPMPLSTSASERKPLPFTSNARKSSFLLALSSAEVPVSA
eukprot:scaffold33516_cov27-Tisochrysis_lutea.AAC.1